MRQLPGYGSVTYGIVSIAAPPVATRGLWITSDEGHLSLTPSDSVVRTTGCPATTGRRSEVSGSVQNTPDVLKHCKEPHL
ncbi:hypothetical protein GCM10023082_18920 [Streptomyces tremellae]|uniref:Uncharacterized protein n=1 Tax=Streptomyces tremellae TaxID=1124239 RepID=A0ABP7EMW1_9ACTN